MSLSIPRGFRIVQEDGLLKLADYLNRYCDQCDGITCTDDEYFDGAGCAGCSDTGDPVGCCRECLVGFAKEDLASMITEGE